MSDIDLKKVNEFQGNAFQCHCCFMYHLNLVEEMWLIFLMVQLQGQTKVTAIWQMVLFSNSEGQSEVFYVINHNCLILQLSIKHMKGISVMLFFNICHDLIPCQSYFGVVSKSWAEIELALCLIRTITLIRSVSED